MAKVTCCFNSLLLLVLRYGRKTNTPQKARKGKKRHRGDDAN